MNNLSTIFLTISALSLLWLMREEVRRMRDEEKRRIKIRVEDETSMGSRNGRLDRR